MKKFCPHCHCEMLERANLYICPRNAIGDCVYDAMLTNELPLVSLPFDSECSHFDERPTPFDSQSKEIMRHASTNELDAINN
ncbi:hypothetical protein JG654_08510 [Vibrio cholerae]|nr:hypothetical protein [Vibrio cholerae]MBJ6960526.1 hypothetical protein [Vibrio cholerae]MBY4645817.1 hypothetical protein [Vibrio cholerae]GHX22890.1 hypothetical protein VCSRO204_1182 [Vibrio cholerae]HAS3599903.1 hypothetical protein [Vibrio cholerae]